MIQPPIHRLPKPALLIGRRRVEQASGGVREHIYAATGGATYALPVAGAAEIDAAVDAAQQGARRWRGLAAAERAGRLHALGRALEAHADELALVQAVESATPLAFARAFPTAAAKHFFYYAGWADKLGGELIPVDPDAFDYAVAEPYGVVAALVPWNGGLAGVAQVLAPVLAAGNAVVLKPSELAPFSALRLAELALEVGLPEGVVNVVTGAADAGRLLVRHAQVAKIHFTGSPATARDVLRGAAENLVPVCLELGGKSALVVCADGDLMAAAQQALAAIVGLCGQGCALPTRVLVAREVQARFVVLLKGLLRRLRVGDPLAPETQVGPLISAAARTRLTALVARAVSQGEGTLQAGGRALEGELAQGFFMAPTLFTDVREDSALACEELFGPVLSVLSFDDEAEALRLANSSVYGLAAYVFSADLRRAQRLAAALEVGSVWINGLAALEPGMPFGGCKQSGYGRLGGRAGLREFTRTKNVWLALAERPAGQPPA